MKRDYLLCIVLLLFIVAVGLILGIRTYVNNELEKKDAVIEQQIDRILVLEKQVYFSDTCYNEKVNIMTGYKRPIKSKRSKRKEALQCAILLIASFLIGMLLYTILTAIQQNQENRVEQNIKKLFLQIEEPVEFIELK